MKTQATTLDAYNLLHEGSLALAEVERNGIRIDTNYLERAIKATDKKIEGRTLGLNMDPIFRQWRKRFGSKTNLDSTVQLGKVLFEDMGHKCPALTKTGKPKVDIKTLETLDIPFVKSFLRIKKLKKAKSTYLMGIKRETVNEFIHPFFHLHLVTTYRGSSSDPNFTNMPIRDYEMGKLIRRCFIPRASNRCIVETDYNGIEVRGAAWYHKDPVMINYINDKRKDMHRDMAIRCYMLPKNEMVPQNNKQDGQRVKDIRFCGKNQFVFPQFYGDWYYSCAQFLWDMISQMKLHTRDGHSLKEHLKKKGIKGLGVLDPTTTPKQGTFIHHIKEVEDFFWNKQFKVYKEWKEDWYDDYQQRGYVTSLTGFVLGGLMKKNEVINYPIQGVAFHCLLWSLIRIQKLLKKHKMKSLIIGQIHDSIVGDVLEKELKNYLEIVQQVMTIDIRKHWKWIITPLEIEAEVAPAGKSWFEKEKYKLN